MQIRLPLLASFLFAALFAVPALAQIRVTPKEAKGGAKQGEPWAEVPESFRGMKIPEWPLPADLKPWQEDGRARTRATLLRCLGEMPARPDPRKVEVLSKEDMGDYVLERFQFHNGVDMVVPGILLIPKNRGGPVPAIVGLHGHGSSKESICTDAKSSQLIGPLLAKKGYVVAAIDGYFNGGRTGKGPAGKLDAGAQGQEYSLFKLNLWLGRSLWGMMLRDEQCLLDYLETRPEVDKQRIAATGMSMGCTRSWWLAAIDDRVQAVVGVACFTRYTELIAHGNLRMHGIYYFVPGVLQHFDTEAIYALVAPRPMLMLSGDQDGGAPTDGIVVLEKKLDAVYGLYGKKDHFRSVIYRNTGHEYLPEMKAEMAAWFDRHVPVGKSVKEAGQEEATNADIYEAVFRHQFKNNSSALQEKAKAYFLKINGKNPSPEFLKRFAGHHPPVHPGSEFQQGEGLLFRIDKLERIDDATVELRGGYYEGRLSASGNLYRVVYRDKKWVVEKDRMLWIS